MRDDAVVTGRPTTMLAPSETEFVASYGTEASLMTAYYYRKVSSGTVRVVVRFDSGQEVDTLTQSDAFSLTPAITLVDATGEITKYPNSHNYMARVQRTSNGDKETITAILLRNLM